MTRRRLLLVGKGLLAAVLIGAVGWHFARLLNKPELWEHPPVARPAYLAAAGVLYLLAHTLWATFFVQLLWSQKADVSWRLGVRAYFVSQFGKYVPGKAWVIVLRVLLLRPAGVDHGVVAVTGIYETLTSMAAGAIIGVCLLPWAGIGLEEFGLAAWMAWIALLAVATLPLSAGVINKLAARMVLKRRGPDGKPLPSPPLRLLVRGLLQDSLGWCFLGLSLWATVTGLTLGDGELTPSRYLQDLAATALSYVAGFVFMFSPGGLGARELVFQRVLTAQFGHGTVAEAQAAVVAIVVRLVWTGFEVVFAGMLYLFAQPGRGTHD